MRYRTHVVAAAGTLLAAASVVPHASLTDVALAVAGTGPGAAPGPGGAPPREPAWRDQPSPGIARTLV
ncbi:hypothetical protein [Streptomyces montanisoli]|uniref:Uncharacterized protein n=1 Tax=Streptomyces montanisoli TaxID=2798581 RepID=A0A940RYG9_9ACTN|nr:hypothetical protein [Streptomyces montanisoli]MBP0462262.1 hypothetical protein [Streptomyces montanisoli]